ncbi:MAG: aldose 1-epimerase [Arenicella sp.]
MTDTLRKSTISDGNGLCVDLLNYGARIRAIDFHGHQLALCLENDEDYLDDAFYLGASIGPICNRIAWGQLQINGELLQMPLNQGKHTLHSGGLGFDKQFWHLESHSPNQICYRLNYDMSLVGMKGRLTSKAIYRVTDGCLTVKYRTSCDTTCFINLTNHVYLNLSGLSDINDHHFQLYADSFVVVDSDKIPTGELKTLDMPFRYQLNHPSHTEFDGLCDHHFNTQAADMGTLHEMLSAVSPSSGISLKVSGDSPGFQFYTGKFLNSPFTSSGGFCVETQLAPDAINQTSFYSPLLQANQPREQVTEYQFNLAQKR